jgi:integrase
MSAKTGNAIAVIDHAGPLAPIQLEERARDFAQEAWAPNTRKAYARDWRDFADWCAAHGVQALPAAPDTVALYIADRAATLKPSSLGRRLASISVTHQAQGFEPPTRSIKVHSVMRGINRTKGTAPEKKRAAIVEDIRAMLAELPNNLKGRRDRALLLVGFAGALRRSELVGLNREDLVFGHEGVTLTIRRSKTDQEGKGQRIGIQSGRRLDTCPVQALRAWLQTAGITEGPVFRPVNRHGQLLDTRLSSQAVALVVKEAAAAAGLDADRYSGHSLRSGFVTTAARARVGERNIMRQTRHRSERIMRGYIEDAGIFIDNASAQVGL